MSHKNCGGVNVVFSTAHEFKNFRNTEHNPMQEIVPCGMILSKNEGLSNWNKMAKPSARNFTVFWESNKWVEYKEGFMITLKAQSLTHLVDKSFIVVDPNLDKAQIKHLYKVMKDSFIHYEAKSIVKMHARTKDARYLGTNVQDI